MRMAQIICNAVSDPDPFYVTDENLTKALDAYCASGGPYPPRDRRSTDK